MEIFNFYKSKLQDNPTSRPLFTCNLFKTLSNRDISILDAPFSLDEIKEAVWNYGGSKAPGPDRFTFKFIKHYWDTIGKDFIDMVKRFERDAFIPRGCNSSFIALVPKIKDPLHVKDFRPISLIGCQYKAQKKKKSIFIFKVDFEKPFDSVDWKFLDNTMRQMGFSETWINWISGCLNSAYISVIVNGSPTKEFRFQKGLCQGDPLLPFLFIIAVEALHVTLQQAKSRNIFEGIKVGSTGVDVSHFQFVDDALIIGKWSHENAKNLCRILRCFELSSGLKVSFSKSKFFGLGASMAESNNLASSLGSKKVILYFEKLRRNFFWGGSLDSNKITWIGWKKVCSSDRRGGLGIGSLQASNLAMLSK
ncbi:RNA-directed DNA polymerase, eukaryota, reverse transcriptase zinc-binding domain protein, partial [Tanacetum coccineum]